MHRKKRGKANISEVHDAAGVTLEDTKLERRHDVRLVAQQQTKLNGIWQGFGHFKNVSSAGAEIQLSGDSSPDEGAEVAVELLDGTRLSAVIMWRRGRSIGLEFDLKFADPSELLHLDHLGQDLFLSAIRHQKSRNNYFT